MKKSILIFGILTIFAFVLSACVNTEEIQVDEKVYLTDSEIADVCVAREVGFDPELDAICDANGLSAEESSDSVDSAPGYGAPSNKGPQKYSSAYSGTSGAKCTECCMRDINDKETCYCCNR
ncbi:MAG: hypothetical protein Q8R18_01130 [bacterium]|nr:hypothetical protein [bacterium]